MLVRAFEVKIRRITRVGQLAQHGSVSRARIEPDIDGIGHLAVLRRIDADVLGTQREPRLDAAGFDALRDLIENRFGLRMQFLGFAVQEKRNRHAPVALP